MVLTAARDGHGSSQARGFVTGSEYPLIAQPGPGINRRATVFQDSGAKILDLGQVGIDGWRRHRFTFRSSPPLLSVVGLPDVAGNEQHLAGGALPNGVRCENAAARTIQL